MINIYRNVNKLRKSLSTAGAKYVYKNSNVNKLCACEYVCVRESSDQERSP